ncbi:hypothetical protein OG203_17590 [Nocardia sp. NBC_01499]|uniref:hypothetical protein n=1 Tax=Nocardia sp. NBC_01499 TaxID=2903597 RepID=UPI0038639B3F
MAESSLPLTIAPAAAAPAPTTQIVNGGDASGRNIPHGSVSCPAGSRLTAGGAQADIHASDSPGASEWDVYLTELQPVYAGDGTTSLSARAAAKQAGTVDFSTRAVCVTAGPSTQVVSNTATSTATGRVDVSVSCPAGTHIVGGGAATRTDIFPPTDYLVSSYPAADLRSWNATAVTQTRSGTATAYAVCAQTGPATQIVSVTNNQLTGDNPGDFVEGWATCPGGTHITGGGAQTMGGYLVEATPAGEPDHQGGPIGWRTQFIIKVPNIAALTTTAICESDTW